VDIGEVIELDDVSFVVFKIPIEHTDWKCSDVLESCPELHQKPSMVLNISSMKDEALLYSKEDFTGIGIEHKSLFIKSGKHVTPDFVVALFFDVVEDFIENAPDGIIGVHATWSVEKTSHLIARYLIEKKGWEPEEALHTVDTTRGEVIAKESVKTDLLECSHLWETEICQHCIVVEFEDQVKTGSNLLHSLIFDVFAHDSLNNKGIEVMDDDVDMDKTVPLIDNYLRVWIINRSLKKQIQTVLDKEELIHENFKIKRFESRGSPGRKY